MGVAAAVAGASLLAWATALSIIDARRRRLPNALTLSGAGIIVLCCAACGRGSAAVIGGTVLAGLYLLVHLVNPAAMGGGDVKLALGLGALTAAWGAQAWVLGALGATMLTAMVGIVSRARGGNGVVAHGPSMCLASLAGVVAALLEGGPV